MAPDVREFGGRSEDDVERRLEEVEHTLRRLMAQRWMGPLLKGSLPATEVRDALPTAEEALAYQVVTIRGDGATTPDVTYQCLRDAGGAWEWAELGSGTP